MKWTSERARKIGMREYYMEDEHILAVNINEETYDFLFRVCLIQEGISATEATRRAFSFYAFILDHETEFHKWLKILLWKASPQEMLIMQSRCRG